MGVITKKNEQYTEDMVSILEIINEYVPIDGESKLLLIAMGGDQLTAARARTAQEVRVTASSEKQALIVLALMPEIGMPELILLR